VTTSSLIAGVSYLGNHFITANYSGDANFSPASVTMVQKVHAKATTLTLSNSIPAAGSNGPITFTATVASSPPGGGIPTGQVTFWDGNTFLAQVPVSTNTGIVSFTLPALTAGSHAVSATYASDSIFASSTGSVMTTAPVLTGLQFDTNGFFRFGFTNSIGGAFSVLGSPDIALPGSNWNVLGQPTEFLPGQFRFTDPQTTNNPAQYYRVRSP
jgi:hypothetical protein